MKKKPAHSEKSILSSISGIQPAEVPPYFYTRLAARMQNEPGDKKESFFLLKPAFLTASLSFLLIVNIVFLLQFNSQHLPASNQSNNIATIQSFSDAYNLDATAVYE